MNGYQKTTDQVESLISAGRDSFDAINREVERFKSDFRILSEMKIRFEAVVRQIKDENPEQSFQ